MIEAYNAWTLKSNAGYTLKVSGLIYLCPCIALCHAKHTEKKKEKLVMSWYNLKLQIIMELIILFLNYFYRFTFLLFVYMFFNILFFLFIVHVVIIIIPVFEINQNFGFGNSQGIEI